MVLFAHEVYKSIQNITLSYSLYSQRKYKNSTGKKNILSTDGKIRAEAGSVLSDNCTEENIEFLIALLTLSTILQQQEFEFSKLDILDISET